MALPSAVVATSVPCPECRKQTEHPPLLPVSAFRPAKFVEVSLFHLYFFCSLHSVHKSKENTHSRPSFSLDDAADQRLLQTPQIIRCPTTALRSCSWVGPRIDMGTHLAEVCHSLNVRDAQTIIRSFNQRESLLFTYYILHSVRTRANTSVRINVTNVNSRAPLWISCFTYALVNFLLKAVPAPLPPLPPRLLIPRRWPLQRSPPTLQLDLFSHFISLTPLLFLFLFLLGMASFHHHPLHPRCGLITRNSQVFLTTTRS